MRYCSNFTFSPLPFSVEILFNSVDDVVVVAIIVIFFLLCISIRKQRIDAKNGQFKANSCLRSFYSSLISGIFWNSFFHFVHRGRLFSSFTLCVNYSQQPSSSIFVCFAFVWNRFHKYLLFCHITWLDDNDDAINKKFAIQIVYMKKFAFIIHWISTIITFYMTIAWFLAHTQKNAPNLGLKLILSALYSNSSGVHCDLTVILIGVVGLISADGIFFFFQFL